MQTYQHNISTNKLIESLNQNKWFTTQIGLVRYLSYHKTRL